MTAVCDFYDYLPVSAEKVWNIVHCEETATVAMEMETLGGDRYVKRYCNDHAGVMLVPLQDPPATVWTVDVRELPAEEREIGVL